MSSQWDHAVDVLVVGSGAAGLSTAVVAAHDGASVLVAEKSELLGGTSATSGGGVWIPCSPHAAALGQQDDADEAFQYIRTLSDTGVSDERIRAYVAGAPAMLQWMAQWADLHFESVPYPDYHQDLPGARRGWRTHFPVAFDGRRLGPEVNLIREASPAASFLGKINWTLEETHFLLHRMPGWRWAFLKMLWRYYGDLHQRLRSPRDRYLTLGNAIIGSLKYTANALQVPIWRHTELVELIRDGQRVVGARMRRQGEELTIRTRRAVMLAAGGFERNATMREAFLPPQAKDPGMSGSQLNNTGDAIRAATGVGAATLNMDSAWWAPVFKVPGEARGRLCAFERAFPGCIIVNQAGRRYMNEAASYHVAAQTMMAADSPQARSVPSWILFDSRFQKRYPMGPLLPIPYQLHGRAVRAIVSRAHSWTGLSELTGLPLSALLETLERFNAGARAGEDPEFHRGASEYDRYYGDPKVSPNPTLAPLNQPPFYAMPLHLGDIGTNGGLLTDAHARVLDAGQQPIEGLYAAGNTAASVMGHSYPAAGATLGPALTFGFLAALHITRTV